MISSGVINEIMDEIGERIGSERRAVVQRWAGILGKTEQGIYRAIGQMGRTGQKRQTRADKGRVRIGVTDEQMEIVAGIMYESWSEKGRIDMPAWKAIKIAEDSGAIPAGVLTECTFNRWMRDNGMSKRAALAPTPHVEMRSEGVNHIHQYDTSQCRQWYVKAIDNGKLKIDNYTGANCEIGFQRWDYKNKPLKGLPIKRHLIVDHYSGAYFVMYFPAEDCATSLEFLFSAWQMKGAGSLFAALGMSASPDQIERAGRIAAGFPFHGAPSVLITDNGSIVKSAHGREVMARLGIEYKTHVVGNPRAKGSVESMMWRWEQAFETELRRKPARDLVELNLRAFEFAAWHQQTRAHSRHGQTRFGMFVESAAKSGRRLRELPEDRQLLRALASRATESRQIDYKGQIHWDGRLYQVLDQGLWGKRCLVGPDIFNIPDLVVECEGKKWTAQALDRVEGGWTEQSVVYGEFRSPRETQTQKRVKEIAAADLSGVEVPEQTVIHEIACPRGDEVQTAGDVVERIYSRVQAKHEIARRQGYPLMNWQVVAINGAFGDRLEVKESELEEIIKELRIANDELRIAN
jgi:hypothetical protein